MCSYVVLSRPSGLLVGQLDRSSFYERRGPDDYRIHLMPLDGLT